MREGAQSFWANSQLLSLLLLPPFLPVLSVETTAALAGARAVPYGSRLVDDERKVPQGRIGRLARLAAMGVKSGAGALLDRSGAASAQHAAEVLGTLRGLAAKVGQMASYVDGIVPEGQRAVDLAGRTSSSVTVILFFSPISERTRRSRTLRSAIVWYSSLAASSVVFSSAKVLPFDSILASTEFHIRLNSSSTK